MSFEQLIGATEGKDHLCTRCLEQIKPKSSVKGSFGVELLIWLSVVFWIPLVIAAIGYSLWRLVSKGKVCPACGSTEFVPLNTERARQLMATIKN